MASHTPDPQGGPGVALDPEAEQIVRGMRGLPRYAEAGADAARASMRQRQAALREHAQEVAEVAELRVPREGGTIAVRLYRPHAAAAPATIVYFHGGGWVVGGLDESDVYCRAVARATGCDVASVDYRLAPEHPFPAAVRDADVAVRWVAEELAGAAGRLVVMGDSSGGNLATVAAIHARDRGGPPIALQVLVYPVTDAAMDAASYREHADARPLGSADMAWFWEQYAPAPIERGAPDMSPLRADLAGLPPAVIVVAGHDPTRDDALAYAARLEAAGVPVTLHRFDDVMHGFAGMVGVLGRAQAAIDAIGEDVRRVVGDGAAPARTRRR